VAIKQRAKLAAVPNTAAIDAFANAADGGSVEAKKAGKYKSINVPFTAEQYAQLEALAEKMGRSKVDAIRRAIAQALSE
jgi:putative lipoic acid-binding regulatory protein